MKTIKVKVVPNAKENSLSEENGRFVVRVSAPASENKANNMLVEVLTGHFGVRKNDVRIVKGIKSREKLVEINQK